MSTPGGRLRPLLRASIVLPVGCRMSIEPLVGADLELLARLAVDVRAAQHGVALDARRQRDRAVDDGPGALGGVDDLVGGAVEDLVVVGFHADADAFV